ncbi:hypothetical protein Clacol_002773 [Clathrus columnatus]|uniref:Ankyrin n=1 Tax=Clathrus columnatus TaxID=1419009 RepID=A0AAV5A6G5_9AGAM|nr:hypothetical protein Clacol_002773 [Clathrus columnatus]
MPVPSIVRPKHNIWVAAGEGDLERVKDHNTYTPMHAAASYGRVDILEYLVSMDLIGGNVNIKDEDNETPLFVVESIEVARWLVEHGADIQCLNTEGNTAAQNLAEEFPEVAAYLQACDSSAPPTHVTTQPPSQYVTEQTAATLTDSVMEDANAIIQSAEAEGRDPESELRDLIGKAVIGTFIAGAALVQDTNENDRDDSDNKRVKYDKL